MRWSPVALLLVLVTLLALGAEAARSAGKGKGQRKKPPATAPSEPAETQPFRDPPEVSGRFTRTGPPWLVRSVHTATPLGDGTILFTGGQKDPFTRAVDKVRGEAELYDPVKGSFLLTGAMRIARGLHTATQLDDGTVLVTGGEAESFRQLASAELYHPDRGRFTPTGWMNTPRQAHAATLLPDGKVLITGGWSWSLARITETAEIYDPATRSFRPTGGAMNAARQLHTATLLKDGKVLIVGGMGPRGPLAEVELYDPASERFTRLRPLLGPRFLHQATRLEHSGKVLVTGGADPQSLPTTEIYDPATQRFRRGGLMNLARQLHTATYLSEDRVLIAGGSSEFESLKALASTELFDPRSEQFVELVPMLAARERHTATPLGDDKVLFVGGHNEKNVLGAEVFELLPVGVQVAPAALRLAPGASRVLTAVVENARNTAVTWSVAKGEGGVSAAGVYTAPERPGSYVVRATSVADPCRVAMAEVTVTSEPSPAPDGAVPSDGGAAPGDLGAR